MTGLDVSTTFVELATAAARAAGVNVEFRVGDAADLPFDTGSFDLAVSQAAFKNFSRPDRATSTSLQSSLCGFHGCSSARPLDALTARASNLVAD